MTKTIDTLVEDIYALMGSGHKPHDAALEHLGKAMAAHIARALAKPEPRGKISASNVGNQCDRYSWYLENAPASSEVLDPWVQLKLLYGHLLEEMALFLAEEAGHTVTHRQHTSVLDGVEGHLDGIIDGVLVDVKSANSRTISKFKNHELENGEHFNEIYMDQISFYFNAEKDNPAVEDKTRVAFLACDKELGHLVLDVYQPRTNTTDVVAKKKKAVASDSPPPRSFFPKPDGKSGNMCLDTECKYCQFKNECWPGLRTFIYSNGPRFLTHVSKVPDVPEV